MICIKIYKYDDNIHQNDVVHSFNGLIKHIFISMNACHYEVMNSFFLP